MQEAQKSSYTVPQVLPFERSHISDVLVLCNEEYSSHQDYANVSGDGQWWIFSISFGILRKGLDRQVILVENPNFQQTKFPYKEITLKIFSQKFGAQQNLVGISQKHCFWTLFDRPDSNLTLVFSQKIRILRYWSCWLWLSATVLTTPLPKGKSVENAIMGAKHFLLQEFHIFPWLFSRSWTKGHMYKRWATKK